jgi:membrane-associated phospholipid phosphatase
VERPVFVGFSSAVLAVSLFLIPQPRLAVAQESRPAAAPAPQVNASQPSSVSASTDRSVDLRSLPSNILKDQQDIFLFPVKVLKLHHVWPTLAVTGITAGLIASDPNTAPAFRTSNSFNGFNHVFSSTNAAAFIAAVPTLLYGVGRLRKDSYAQDTALLAGEAIADGFVLSIPFKAGTGRKQPLDYTGNGPYSDSFFAGSHNPFRSGGFYSVHAMAATALATVIAHRYRSHRWVPFVAYGLAAAISFSRITRSDHFPSDAFFGGAMGFFISRYVVLPGRN